MSAILLQFPNNRARLTTHADHLDSVAELIAQKIADLPFEDKETSIVKLLRSIDSKLGRLISAEGADV